MKTSLRSKVHPLRVTSIASDETGFPGSIRLAPEICWAARLTELEQVEVVSLTNGARIPLAVLIGSKGEVRIPDGDAYGFEPGDPISVASWSVIPAGDVNGHEASIVLIAAHRNAPIEIRRQTARPVLLEPSFNPPPPPVVTREPVATA